MSILKIHIITLLLILGCAETMAQADINMSTHWYNRGKYNPAFITRPDYFFLFANYRQQWVGVEGAPVSYTLQMSQYVHALRSAFGLSLMNDQIGVSQALNPMLTYAYRLKAGERGIISFGLSGGFFQRSIDGSEYEADVMTDPSVNYTLEKTIRPDANAGVELQTQAFILGFSATHLFSARANDDDYLNTHHRYGYAIYKNNNSDNFYYRLGLHVVNRNNITVIEGNAFVRLKHATGLMKGPREIFDLGISVRSSRQMSFMMGILLHPDIRFAYVYDHSFTRGYRPGGTHEIMLEYRILSKAAATGIVCGRRQD